MNVVQVKSERGSKKTSERPTTRQRHEDLRTALLNAAEQQIEANGLIGLHARSLALNAGCSVGAIYNVFPDLDALILAVNANTLLAINQKMAAIPATSPRSQFAALAAAYLDYAVRHRTRWDTLFTHRLPPDILAPAWFLAIQNTTFSHIESPLAQLRPDLPAADLTLLARSLFAAIHGIVAFGLEHRTGPIDRPALEAQLQAIAEALAAGLVVVDLS